MKRPFVSLLALCAFVAAGILAAPAVTVVPDAGVVKVKKVEFPRKVQLDDRTLEVRGKGLLEWWTVDVYSAAFYLPEEVPSSPQSFLGEEAAYLLIHYHRGIDAEDFIEATKKSLEKNPNTPWDELQPQLEKLYDMFEDVEKGDRYCIATFPDGRTEIRLNDELRGTFQGEEFASAFLGIWVSEYPLNKSFRDKLLGRR